MVVSLWWATAYKLPPFALFKILSAPERLPIQPKKVSDRLVTGKRFRGPDIHF